MNDDKTIRHALLKRRTYKILADTDQAASPGNQGRDEIDNLLLSAGNAPVHYACDRVHLDQLTSPVPWRVYKFEGSSCRSLMSEMLASGDTTKIPNMLAAAEYLLQVTWLPDEGTIRNAAAGKEEIVFDGTLRNMEHIAAASSFIHSLLLVFEEAGFKTYWSSGGPLRSAAMFENMKIPLNQLLLGSVFLFPQDIGSSEVKTGSMADRRGSPDQWSVWAD